MSRAIVLIVIAYAPSAHAYLDPGSGSLLFASLFGIIATGFFVLKSAYYRLLELVGRRGAGPTHAHGIVCYSEGSHYWSTFRPLIAALNRLGHRVTYLTSDSEDVAFDSAGELLAVSYIGRGSRAYGRLNFLNADVCVLTTPGLDVLQIKRSRGVGQYVHLVHSAMDAHTYKLFSFDYYDAVLCSGQHQIESMRMLEARRSTHAKKLLLTGCLYFDELLEKRRRFSGQSGRSPARRVLIAPTWGRNGLLDRFGAALIGPLVEHGLEVIVRPHPQSLLIEQEMLAALADAFGEHDNLIWDDDPDNFDSLSRADVMVSDISGVMFDYVFLFERPVITIDFEPDWLGTEGFDMETEAFELTVLDSVGRRVAPEDIHSLPRIVEEVSRDRETVSEIVEIRDRMVANFGRAGPVAAGQVLALVEAPSGAPRVEDEQLLPDG